MAATVHDNPAESRYEVSDGQQLAGFAAYEVQGSQIAFTHTEVSPEFEGRGLARRLVTEALDDARRRGLTVLPLCPYVRSVIARSADRYLDLVPEADRDRWGLPEVGG